MTIKYRWTLSRTKDLPVIEFCTSNFDLDISIKLDYREHYSIVARSLNNIYLIEYEGEHYYGYAYRLSIEGEDCEVVQRHRMIKEDVSKMISLMRKAASYRSKKLTKQYSKHWYEAIVIAISYRDGLTI